MAYCEQADLELAVGGAANLVRLLDKDRDDVADADAITACLARATSEIDSALQIRHQLPLTTDGNGDYPAILVTHAASLAAYYAHQYGTDGQGVPQRIAEAAKDARDWLDLLAAGTRTVGTTVKPTADLEAAQVDTNPHGGWVTRDSLKGGIW